MTDRARLWLMVLGAVWVMSWGYSFIVFATTEPDDMGFTRGMNRVMAFLGWQAIAGLLALPIWSLGRGWPRQSGVRRISALPIGLALLLLAAILTLVVWVGIAPG